MGTQPTGYPVLRGKSFMAALEPYFSSVDMEKIAFAYSISKYGHKGQERDSGIRYFEHPRAVAWILFDELHIDDWQLLATALLHDIVEDSWVMTNYRIEFNFGKEVFMDVKYMSHEENLTDDGYWLRFHRVGSWRAVICKLADRLHNLRTLRDVTPEKQMRKLAETREEVFPLFEIVIDLAPERYKPSVVRLTEMIKEMVDELERGLTK